MQYKIIVDKQSSSNPSSEKKEYIVDIEELRVKGNVYDSLVITKDETYVMRRLSLSEYHVLNELEKPIKETLTDLNIELFEGDNYIYLVDMTGNNLCAEYIVKNDFTDLYVTRNEMNSSITQSAEQIELSVNQKLTDYATTQEMNSAITQSAQQIQTTVSQTLNNYSTTEEMNSALTQTAEEFKMIVNATISSPNLIANSEFANSLEDWETEGIQSVIPYEAGVTTINNKKWFKISNSEGPEIWYLLRQKIVPISQGTDYTFSSLIKAQNANGVWGLSFSISCYFYNTNKELVKTETKTVGNFENQPDEEVISATFKSPSNENISYCDLEITINCARCDVLITNLQFEKGNAPTQWNPSQAEFYSLIKQTVDEISTEVSKKVGNTEVISKINQSAEAVKINANKIELSANDILNLLAGNTINLTSKNIAISSDNFTVDKNGKMTCNNAVINAVGGNGNDGANGLNLKVTSENGETYKYSGFAPGFGIIRNGLYNYINFQAGVGDNDNYVTMQMMASSPQYSITNTINPGTTCATRWQDSSSSTQVASYGITTPNLTQTSLESIKKNITKLEKNATDIINNSDIYEYNLKADEDNDKKLIGFVIGEKYRTPKEVISKNGDSIELYSAIGILWKAVQELTQEIKQLKGEKDD